MDERLEYKALHDTLTELPNWTLFQDRLRHSLAFAKRNATLRAVMFVELTGLQHSPDNLGRNSLLKEAAYRLSHVKREIDTLTRFRGDTFALLFENVPDNNHLDLIVNRVVDAFSKPFEIKGQKIKVEPNIHVSICTGLCVASENPKNANIKQCFDCVLSKKTVVSEVTL
jgi:diguanylate cyclase (GGDEF)-like protein